MSPGERTSFLAPIDKDVIQDPSTGLAGFVANEVEQQDYNSRTGHDSYGATAVDDRTATSARCDLTFPPSETPEFALSSSRIRIIMISMFLGIFLAALDGTIVSTLLTRIGSEFNSLDKVSWIATSYLLSSSTCQPLYGKLSDQLGRKPLLVFSNVVFSIGCLICGMSTSIWLSLIHI